MYLDLYFYSCTIYTLYTDRCEKCLSHVPRIFPTLGPTAPGLHGGLLQLRPVALRSFWRCLKPYWLAINLSKVVNRKPHHPQIVGWIFLAWHVIEGSFEVRLPTIWRDGKAEAARVREEKREDQRGERVRRKKRQVREKVEKSRFTVFLQ